MTAAEPAKMARTGPAAGMPQPGRPTPMERAQLSPQERARIEEVKSECQAEVVSCEAAASSALELVEKVAWEEQSEQAAADLESMYMASMSAATTLLREAHRFVTERSQKEAANTPGGMEVKQELAKNLASLQKLEQKLNAVKTTVAEGKERAAWSGKFDAVKSEVEQVEGEVRGVVTRAGQIATDQELAEVEAEIAAVKEAATEAQKQLSAAKLNVVAMLRGVTSVPSARKLVTDQLQKVSNLDAELKESVAKAGESLNQAKASQTEKEAEAKAKECEDLATALAEQVAPCGDEKTSEVAQSLANEVKGKAADAIAKCKEARVVLSGEVWRGKGMTTERRKLQVELLSRVNKAEQKINMAKSTADKAVEEAEQRAATAEVRVKVDEANAAVAAAVEKGKVLDGKFKDEAEAEAAQKEVSELVTKARELLGTAKTAVLAKIQEKVVGTTAAGGGLKRALSELMVNLNGGATTLNKEQQKADLVLDKMACDNQVEAITTAVTGVETAFEKATELATSVTDETPAEELDALAAKVESSCADAKAKAKAASDQCVECLKGCATDVRGPKAEMRGNVQKMKIRIGQGEAKLNQLLVKVQQRVGMAHLAKNLEDAEAKAQEVEVEVRQAVEDTQTLAEGDLSELTEARVTQLASLVDDALASAKASIAASKALNEKITSTVRSAGPKAAAELKVIQAIVARVNAAEAQLNAKTGPIAREVGGAQAKIEVQKLETEVADADAAATAVVEEAAPLETGTLDLEATEALCAKVSTSMAAARAKLEALSQRATAITSKPQLPQTPAIQQVKQSAVKLRGRFAQSLQKLRKPEQLVTSAPAAAKIRAEVAHLASPVTAVEADSAKVVELHKQLLVVLREGSEEDVKKHAADMEAQANAARKKVEEAKAGLKTALEGDIKPELKPEVVKLQRRADACDVKLRSAQMFSQSAPEKAAQQAKVKAATAEVDKLEEDVKALTERVDTIATAEQRVELGSEKVRGVAEKEAAECARLQAHADQSVGPGVTGLEKPGATFALKKRVDELLKKLDAQAARCSEASEAMELLAWREAAAQLKKAQQELGEASLFKKINSSGSGAITVQELAAYLKTATPPRGEEEAAKVFAYFDLASSGKLAEKDFQLLVKDTYQCAKAIAMSDGFEIGKSKILRKLEVGEMAELVEGPQEDTSSKVQRVKVRSMKDATTGWVTVQGNQGTVFLEQVAGEAHLAELDTAVQTRRKKSAEAAKLEKDCASKVAAADAAATAVDAKFRPLLSAEAMTVAEAHKLAPQCRTASMAQKNGAVRVALALAIKARDMVPASDVTTKTRVSALVATAEAAEARLAELVLLSNGLVSRAQELQSARAAARTNG